MTDLEILAASRAERQPCEVWTRVMGYHRPTHAFNPGKRAEYRERRFFREPTHSAVGWGEPANPNAPEPVLR